MAPAAAARSSPAPVRARPAAAPDLPSPASGSAAAHTVSARGHCPLQTAASGADPHDTGPLRATRRVCRRTPEAGWGVTPEVISQAPVPIAGRCGLRCSESQVRGG